MKINPLVRLTGDMKWLKKRRRYKNSMSNEIPQLLCDDVSFGCECMEAVDNTYLLLAQICPCRKGMEAVLFA